jgi:YHS domain-containing protein
MTPAASTRRTTTLRRAALALVAVVATALSGCAAMWAQNPSSPLKPVRATAIDADAHVMLDGHDVVAYFTQGRHAMGQANIKSVYQEVTFRFATAEHKTLFDKEPTKYVPQYGGFCANGIVYGIPWGGDADTWKITDGKLYIFGGAGSKAGYLLDEAGNRKLADQYWAAEVSGSNSFWQRSKRLVFRVPHYKGGEEIARLVKEAADKKK